MKLSQEELRLAVKPYLSTHTVEFIRKVIKETKENHKNRPFNDFEEVTDFVSMYIADNGAPYLKVAQAAVSTTSSNERGSPPSGSLPICSLCGRPIMEKPVIAYGGDGTIRYYIHGRDEYCSSRRG